MIGQCEVATPDELKREIAQLIRSYFVRSADRASAHDGLKAPLAIPSFGWEEVAEAVDSLLDQRTTMGVKVRTFEERFAHYLGVRHAVMVNSGSSANLVALSLLMSPSDANPLVPGDEVITPALTWATTVFPIAQLGLVPVLVDIEPDTLNIDPAAVERAITPRTRAIMPVHALGNPCDMTALMEIARAHGLRVIEDACEAHGAEWDGRKVGGFGDLGTFSFFFSHHITTMEGGMVVTDDEAYAERARALRAFGWVRDSRNGRAIAGAYPHLDPRFLFTEAGYNFRPTELQGAFGMHQVAKLDGFVEQRRANAARLNAAFAPLDDQLLLPVEAPRARHAYFGYALHARTGVTFDRNELIRQLEAHGIETRPLMAGNIVAQPAIRGVQHRVVGPLPHAEHAAQHGIFVGIHHGLSDKVLANMARVVQAFFVPERAAAFR